MVGIYFYSYPCDKTKLSIDNYLGHLYCYFSCVMASLTLDHHLSVWICVAQKSWSSVSS